MWKKMASVAASAALIALSAVGAFAQSLGLGDPAPKLTVKEFVKGKPITEFAPDKTYVVEFWATWCGPCKVSIPHLTKLQKQYKDVPFIGVSVWEDDPSLVKPFVEKQGDNMDYTVCMDSIPADSKVRRGMDGAMAQNWMKAAGRNGIPSAFIVQDGKIAWIGHPMQMDEPLAKVVAGNWDLKAARVAYDQEMAAAAVQRKLNADIQAAQKDKDYAKVVQLIDEAAIKAPALETSLASIKFGALVRSGQTAQAVAFGEKIIASAEARNASTLNAIATQTLLPDADPSVKKIGLAASEKAVAVTDGPMHLVSLETLARVQYANGDTAKAVANLQKALDGWKTVEGVEANTRDSYVDRLTKQMARYKGAGE